MSWFWLVLAGICEVGWPLGLKLASNPAFKIWGPALALVSMTLSGIFLWLSLKGIPIGSVCSLDLDGGCRYFFSGRLFL